MYGDDYFIRSETDYRTEQVRRAWGRRRRGARTRTRRWQGPLRGAGEMR
ncbi:hypothetical protein [Nocardioides campestrisoli]|nr:hypothetical protein [Nocardioides campestrisoli]